MLNNGSAPKIIRLLQLWTASSRVPACWVHIIRTLFKVNALEV